MGSEDEFDEADLCFTSSIEMNIFDNILDSYGHLRTEKSLIESEAESDLTDSEEGFYRLTNGQRFANWKG
ncbi:hypothetical protein F8M41_016501 [Gigaspora margarita]|uniref:Uncharacterized protein n=1 Tax=Gigaspora margarita TaxID=4874 RepID=A0A8H3WWX9_GIGMA|nr:hypothetical protein F8M41_017599 [Gigaspora margarita]KAF0337552.1 hypothetical protein F8M41_016501 [Gigaspora margarita]